MKRIVLSLIFVLGIFLMIPMNSEAAGKMKLNKTKIVVNEGDSFNIKLLNNTTGKKPTWSVSTNLMQSDKKSKTTFYGVALFSEMNHTETITCKVNGKKFKCKVIVKDKKYKHLYVKETVTNAWRRTTDKNSADISFKYVGKTEITNIGTKTSGDTVLDSYVLPEFLTVDTPCKTYLFHYKVNLHDFNSKVENECQFLPAYSDRKNISYSDMEWDNRGFHNTMVTDYFRINKSILKTSSVWPDIESKLEKNYVIGDVFTNFSKNKGKTVDYFVVTYVYDNAPKTQYLLIGRTGAKTDKNGYKAPRYNLYPITY